MAENPYKVTTQGSAGTASWLALAARLVAVPCWVVSTFFLVSMVAAVQRQEWIERTQERPLLALGVIACSGLFPAIGLFTLGSGFWKRSLRIGLLGIAIAILPMLLFVTLITFVRI